MEGMVWGRQPEKNKRNNYFRKGLKGRVDSPYG